MAGIPAKFLSNNREKLRARLGNDDFLRFESSSHTNHEQLRQKAPVFKSAFNRRMFEYAIPCLAMYRALLDELGMKKDDAFVILKDIVQWSTRSEIEANWFNRLMLRMSLSNSLFGKIYTRTITGLKEEHGWLAEAVPGPALVSFNMTRCAILEYLKTQQAAELCPVFCFADQIAAKYVKGIRFERTGTLAEGAEVCDFRYYSADI
jgi:hypothetical protein